MILTIIVIWAILSFIAWAVIHGGTKGEEEDVRVIEEGLYKRESASKEKRIN